MKDQKEDLKERLINKNLNMKKYFLFLLLIIGSFNLKAQSCNEIIDYVKSKDYGSTLITYNSEVISKVTFYTVYIDYIAHYFAIVCFKKKHSYSCDEYIYQVGSNTKYNYTLGHYDSAGKAFWEHIQPYNKNLDCAPNFN